MKLSKKVENIFYTLIIVGIMVFAVIKTYTNPKVDLKNVSISELVFGLKTINKIRIMNPINSNLNIKVETKYQGATQGIVTTCKKSKVFEKFVATSLLKHLTGNWGDTPLEDQELNNLALEDGSRILSSYFFPKELIGQNMGYMNSVVTEESKIWIDSNSTDDNGNREATIVMYPSEY